MRRSNFIKCVLTAISMAVYAISGAQPQKVEFVKTVHDFGDIMLNSGHHKYTFTFKNTSQQPVVIQTVISSCGCTTTDWTRSPIMPGESGKIDATFLNDQGPYPFDKSLTVYITGEQRPVVLRIKGVVHEKSKTLKELFPVNYGEISLRSSYIDLGNIARGEIRKEVIEIANTSSRVAEVSFSALPAGVRMDVNPKSIAPGKRGELEITFNSSQTNTWGSISLTPIFVVNGRAISEKEFTIQANIRDNFRSLTKEELDNAPVPMANSSTFDFGSVKQGSSVLASFRIRNLGRRDLIIHKIDLSEPNIKVKHPTKITPGSTGIIEASIVVGTETGEKGYILSLITNSPSRPVMNLIITGVVNR